MKPLEETVLMVVNPRASAKSEVKFVVVPNDFTNLQGLKTIQELGFITINEECFISQIKAPQLDDLGEATLRIDENAQSKVLSCRKMITPFGRYRWKRLPFGLKVSSEIFQRKLDEALGGLKGVFSVVDDVVVAGCGQTMEEAQIDNQQKLAKTLKR